MIRSRLAPAFVLVLLAFVMAMASLAAQPSSLSAAAPATADIPTSPIVTPAPPLPPTPDPMAAGAADAKRVDLVFRRQKVGLVLQSLAHQGGVTIEPKGQIADQLIDILVQRVTVEQALETIVAGHDWSWTKRPDGVYELWDDLRYKTYRPVYTPDPAKRNGANKIDLHFRRQKIEMILASLEAQSGVRGIAQGKAAGQALDTQFQQAAVEDILDQIVAGRDWIWRWVAENEYEIWDKATYESVVLPALQRQAAKSD